jgi:hypothetical protein
MFQILKNEIEYSQEIDYFYSKAEKERFAHVLKRAKRRRSRWRRKKWDNLCGECGENGGRQFGGKVTTLVAILASTTGLRNNFQCDAGPLRSLGLL